MTELTLALEKVDFLPPDRVTDDTSVLTLKNLVFEPLLRWEEGQARPGLFARWEHDAAGRSWRFFLREGATFHDGRACTAADVLDFITGLLGAVDTFGMKWSYARYLARAEMVAESAGCLALRNPAPIADILDIFSEFYPCRRAPDGHATLGTGPYRVVEFAPRQRAVLERVADLPAPARLVAVEERGAEARLERLRAGRADAALNLERIEHRITRDPALSWQQAVNTLSVMYYLNCASGPFASREARLAVNHAVNVPRIIAEVFHGLGVPAATIVSPFHLGHRAAGVAPLPYDPARARALFDKAGVSGEILIRSPDHMPEKALEVSARVRDDLAAIGIAARIEHQPDRPEYAREIGRKQMGDMAIFDSSPHSTYRVLNDKISSAVRGIWWQGHDDAELEEMILAANAAVAPEAREAAYGSCLARLNHNPPWLYLFHPIEVLAHRPGAAPMTLDHKGVLRLLP
ncbi:ABC transporter substrate-binding protein [Roseomonas sp. GC11]|uniref:ABC transporter substrate-binding protein n=1 Tax=Roseomonas sp. GC11 TaxID=2950546 RepID=UPI002108A1F1|nr:ABC transporter substrate-binding protein [Roseomonas sp. GC11]MCQ4162358.1 ABC transporter substrate-binding protein [Roseomonas sp. GC11]